MFDVQMVTRKLNSVPDPPTYGFARAAFNIVSNLIDQTASLDRGVMFGLFGGSYDTKTITRYREQLYALQTSIYDTNAHAPDDDYNNWGALRQLWINVCIESNAIQTAVGTSLDNVSYIPDDVQQSVEAIPTTVGNATGAVIQWTSDQAGKAATGLLSGLSPILIVVGLVGIGALLLLRKVPT